MNPRSSPRRRQWLHGLAQTALASQRPQAFLASAQTANLLPTPACGAPAQATAEQAEGARTSSFVLG